jgi:hypothetical protein
MTALNVRCGGRTKRAARTRFVHAAVKDRWRF